MTAGVWRYVLGGAVRHRLLEPDALAAVCGLEPWGGRWLGGGDTVVEAVTVHGLPDCRNCVRRAR